MLKVLVRSMSTLSKLPKTQSFTQLKADALLPTSDTVFSRGDIIHVPRVLQSGAFSYTLPEPRKSYQYLTLSQKALDDLGLDSQSVNDSEFVDIVSGKIYEDEKFTEKYPVPYSQAYAGWQFGQFAGQLGDGRVDNLFEVPKHKSDDSQNRRKYEIQLKGAGLTPFSRFADGKAVLRSSIREYVISEHLNAIGIPTTRALSLVYLPDTRAKRYTYETCAIVSRFAELWIRIGTFDLYRMRGDRQGIRELSDYCISELFTVNDSKFPYLLKLLDEDSSFLDGFDDQLNDYDKMYFEIVIRNAYSTAQWQSYGFLNGVLNTDNTSILGLSMDYGPFSIMDKFKPEYTPNSEDLDARYGYRNTPTAIWWNLTRLGEDLAELIGAGKHLSDPDFSDNIAKYEDDIIKRATKIIEIAGLIYTHSFTKKYVEKFYARLGLSPALISSSEPDKQNQELIAPLLKTLEKVGCDFNVFFARLQALDFTSQSMDFDAISNALKASENELYSDEEMVELLSDWLKLYQQELAKSEKLDFDRASARQYNPLFLPRNWILDEVIDKTESSKAQDLSYLHKLEKMAFNPFDRSKWGDELKEVEEKWLKQGELGEKYSMLQCSCSS